MKDKFSNIKPLVGGGKKVYVETYGCQMNVSDSEVVVSIMQNQGFFYTENIEEADVIFINTCSIRDNAEQRIWGRLNEFKQYKKRKPGLVVGVLGCMAERLKEQLIEKEAIVDIVAGPDAYRDIPTLVARAASGEKAVNVILSRAETYEEISPVRLDKNGVTSFVAIMRGCNNMCSYCVVPYTRGGERSRNPKTIMNEIRELLDNGYREVTLLGQNVNSYLWDENDEKITFPKLLEMVAMIDPKLRVRFATSHPKDLSDEVLYVISRHKNLCRAIHLPAQSGNNRMLDLMNRKYTREWYLDRIAAIRRIVPDCAISTDIIAGFCTETETEHQDTVSLMREVGYEFAYMFKYSQRDGTKAARTMEDDVAEDIKTARLTEIINLQNTLSLDSNKKDVGKIFEVLVEGYSKRDKNQLFGRTSQNKVVVFTSNGESPGDYVDVLINDCSSATLLGERVGK